MRDPIALRARKAPFSLAFIDDKSVMNYLALDRRIARYQTRLAKDYQRNDPIAFALDFSLEAFCVFWAFLRLSCRLYLVNLRQPRELLLSQLREHGLQQLFDRLPSFSAKGTKTSELDDHCQTLLFTSGTSGKAKLRPLSLEKHYYSAIACSATLDFKEGDRWYLCLPCYHVSGLSIIFRSVFAGATFVFSKKELPQALKDYKLSHLSLVSLQLKRLLAEKELCLKYLRAILLGGSALPKRLVNEGYHRGLPLYPSYGMTEAASTIAILSKAELEKHLKGQPWEGSSGKVLPYRDLSIDPSGEIILQGKVLFTSEPYASGDLAYFEGAKLFVKGRKDRMFISAGENIYPEEIERALLELDFVERAFVLVVDDEEFTMRALAFVQMENFSEEKIKEGLRKLLASYKLPRQFFAWPSSKIFKEAKVSKESFVTYLEQERTFADK